MEIKLRFLNYLCLFFILLALVISFIILSINIYNKDLEILDTWQFPLLLALVFDEIVYIF